jgi:hypothetical protein
MLTSIGKITITEDCIFTKGIYGKIEWVIPGYNIPEARPVYNPTNAWQFQADGRRNIGTAE